MKEAMFFKKLAGKKVHCGLCRFRCPIADGRRGICGVRENREGVLYTLVYGKCVAEQVDPIEKKPLFHFLPGSLSYSVATMGCNFRCRHCQNHRISQPPREGGTILGIPLMPEEIVAKAHAAGCRSISYTYTEPTIFFEYAYDTAVLAQRNGLKNIFVTNGYISEEALSFIRPYLDAVNIDLKGFTDSFYREVAGGAVLNEVLESIRLHKRLGIWLEITTLIIPGLNDSDEELAAIARFIADEVSPDTPWHVSSFHPDFQMTDRSWTPLATVRRARQIGLAAGLRYVYEGNVPGDGGENTLCPVCHARLVTRSGFHVQDLAIRAGKCSSCGFELAGVWE
ncbi:MAG: AmmeMemoRadiSam system radical SAM enzyme [Deltaproteobacteria bacterium]|nr:AmmeMemoRadiSam system radical SAM enzyme [Deltaproteobacteria bacterium]TLN05201.1 MAG: AmmeMemoRadiSam system radical SAM enzyme [bacterium]